MNDKMRVLLADIAAVADQRPQGYISAIMAAGQVQGDWLEIEAKDLMAIKERFGTGTEPPMAGCQGCGG
jgi:hypothetical protein